MPIQRSTLYRSHGLMVLTDIDTGKTLFESDLHQCCHCQFTWQYKPGSGIRRGLCKRCGDITCGRTACDTCYPHEQQLDDLEAVERTQRARIEAAVRLHEWKERLGVR